jgi:hypothetical protein
MMNWNAFRDHLLGLILNGANMKNVGGQRKMFSVWLQPEVDDSIDKIRELLPKGWHGDDAASLKRAIVLTGLASFIAVLEADPKVKLSVADQKKLAGIKAAVANMNLVAREGRINDLQKQAEKAADRLIRSKHPNRNVLVANLIQSHAALEKLLSD